MQLPLAANALATLGNGAAVVGNQQPPQPQQMPQDNPGILQAQLMQQAQQRKLAEALMGQGYIPNSGGLGALAMVLSAYKGKKLAKESDEKASDYTKRLLEAQAAQQAAEAERTDPYNQRMRYLQQAGMDASTPEAQSYLLTGNMPKKDSRYMNVSPGGSIFDPETGQTVYKADFAPRSEPQARMQSVSVPQSDGSFRQMNFDPISGQYTDPFGQQPPQQQAPQQPNRMTDERIIAIANQMAKQKVPAEQIDAWVQRQKSMDFNTDQPQPTAAPSGPVLGMKPADKPKAMGEEARIAAKDAAKLALDFASRSTGIPVEELQKLDPVELENVIKAKGNSRALDGPVIDSIPFLGPAIQRATQGDTLSASEAAAAKIARTNNPTGQVTNADVDLARMSTFRPGASAESNAASIRRVIEKERELNGAPSARPRVYNKKTNQWLEHNGQTWVLVK